MINELLLLSGNDIPLEEINLILHPPTIKEISLIGEENWFAGCEFLRFSKERLKTEDKNGLNIQFMILIILKGISMLKVLEWINHLNFFMKLKI